MGKRKAGENILRGTISVTVCLGEGTDLTNGRPGRYEVSGIFCNLKTYGEGALVFDFGSARFTVSSVEEPLPELKSGKKYRLILKTLGKHSLFRDKRPRDVHLVGIY